MTPERSITCTNSDGTAQTFGTKFSPFLLIDVDGLYGYSGDVHKKDNAMTDGATYYGTSMKFRNIVMTVADRSAHQKHRSTLYNLFRLKDQGTLIYTENGIQRKTSYTVEKVTPSAVNNVRTTAISLICADPYFYDPENTEITMGKFYAEFEFPFEIEDAFEFGNIEREKSRTIEIGEDDDTLDVVDGIGLTIVIEATGTVKNPVVTCSHLGIEERIQFQDTTIGATDKIVITTGSGEKKVLLNGVNAFNNTTNDTKFIQLQHGSNTISFDAEEGSSHMSVDISYQLKYGGA